MSYTLLFLRKQTTEQPQGLPRSSLPRHPFNFLFRLQSETYHQNAFDYKPQRTPKHPPVRRPRMQPRSKPPLRTPRPDQETPLSLDLGFTIGRGRTVRFDIGYASQLSFPTLAAMIMIAVIRRSLIMDLEVLVMQTRNTVACSQEMQAPPP